MQRMYLWWSLCTLYLLACQVRVTVGDSGLCFWFLRDVFRALVNSFACWLKVTPFSNRLQRFQSCCAANHFEKTVENRGQFFFQFFFFFGGGGVIIYDFGVCIKYHLAMNRHKIKHWLIDWTVEKNKCQFIKCLILSQSLSPHWDWRCG